jgi:hypothetical protein
VSIPDAMAGAQRALVNAMGRDASYTPAGGATVTLRVFIRGLRAEDLFADARQQDQLGVIDADAFATLTGKVTPRRMDRLTTPVGSFTVEGWRGAPNDGGPVVFKLLLRGGQQ